MSLPAVASASRGKKTQSETKTFMLAARRPLVASLAIYTGLRRSEGASKRVVLQTGLYGGGWNHRCRNKAHPEQLTVSFSRAVTVVTSNQGCAAMSSTTFVQERFGISAGVDFGNCKGMLYKRYNKTTLFVTRHSIFLNKAFI